VKILDGTGLSMPDTPKNQKRWPQPCGQKPGCGLPLRRLRRVRSACDGTALSRHAFPLLRMAVLFCMGSGALLRYAFGNKHDQENWLCRGVLDGLEKDDVLLADRGFCSFGLIGVMLARGVDCVMRLHQARPCDFRQGRRLGRNDRLVTWRKNPSRKNDPWAGEHASLPAMLAIRLVRFRVEVPGFRTEQVIVATTLLDPQEYPAEMIAGLYRARWNIELRYRERVARQRPPMIRGAHPAQPPERQIKTTMGAEVLRCKSGRSEIAKGRSLCPKGSAAVRRRQRQLSERLDYKPARFLRRRTVRPKYVQRGVRDAVPIVAPLPDSLLERSLVAPGLLAQIVVSKYCDHLPLHRQESIYWTRHQVWLPRQRGAQSA
jgi:hypothetical protein